ncbi:MULTISPECIES: tRNA pseudouridine(38-40) synthase TruA [Dehalococcoides]|uniref:tRNA pseudouridine synthase A n=1 Tax=Dehalococcoides mccartyi TaxID=61435 RepID=A0AB38ZB71_9CHLR|nr:tRNA pseudouridine(38-40) synthase TruA [Dehalococcoides mccartyi]WRO07825.1 tRNA pseudouridine(38-40) synthase TruA [Dehalococcoides mccartyi]
MLLVIEYEGTRYSGFQVQDKGATIQGELETAIRKLTSEQTRVSGSGRTDAGVHAAYQVVSYLSESSLGLEKIKGGLNFYLPPDIAVKEVHFVAESFDVRRRAISREYSYQILNSKTRSPLARLQAWQVPYKLDIKLMEQAFKMLEGEHDFIAFASSLGPEIKKTVRRVNWTRLDVREDRLIFNIEANSFLTHQVRNTIGTLVELGRGTMSRSEFEALFEAKTPGLAGPAAPACGLSLVRVNYREPFGS